MSSTKTIAEIAPNSCATVALLNVVNNVEHIDLGEQLKQFKEDTTSLSPEERGDAIANFDFVRGIHNSFARYVIRLVSLAILFFLERPKRPLRPDSLAQSGDRAWKL